MKAAESNRMSENSLIVHEHLHTETPEVSDIHRAVLREQFEPSEGQQRVPVLLFIAFLALAMWAGWYLSEFDGNFQSNLYDGPNAFRAAETSTPTPSSEVIIDPMLLGKRIYNNCVSCHQSSGEGLVGQYPPLNESEWVLGDDRILSRILINGLIGPIDVRGKSYNGQMPAWKQLSDQEIAAVLTYIRSAWSNDGAPVSESTVANVRSRIAGRTTRFKASELKALPLAPRLSSLDLDPKSSLIPSSAE